MVREKKTRDDASAICGSKGSNLIEITKDEEFEFVAELMRTILDKFWIGATDRDVEGRYVYQHSMEPVPDKYWREGGQIITMGNIILKRTAANDTLFKLFFSHPFLASKIYINTFKTKSNIGLCCCCCCCCFRYTGFRMDSLFSILKIYTILLKSYFHHIY